MDEHAPCGLDDGSIDSLCDRVVLRGVWRRKRLLEKLSGTTAPGITGVVVVVILIDTFVLLSIVPVQTVTTGPERGQNGCFDVCV